MPKNYIQGAKTKVFFTVMPNELLALPTLTAPTDSPITTTAAIVALDVTVAVAALTKPVPAGTPITLSVGLAKLTVYTTAHAVTGATSLAILPIPTGSAGLATAATGIYIAKLQLRGGTTSQRQIQNADTVIKNYRDPGEVASFEDGIVTSAGWDLNYSFSLLSDDDGSNRLSYCSLNSLAGVRGYVWRELGAPPGYSKGKVIEGLVDVLTNSEDAPADNVVSGQVSFKGRGNPIETPAMI